MPFSSDHQPDPRHLTLGDAFFDAVEPAACPASILRFRNRRWAQRVGLGTLNEAEWLDHFVRFQPLPDNLPQPLALRYHGHQFRSYNPELGDGRGFLFAQMRDPVDGRLLDLGSKGSGRTPWSRRGDGRLTLKGGLREVLATEMLEALGVYTSKSFSLIETGEALQRNDEPSPTRSAVLVRLGHSHVRFGTFQRLMALGDEASLRRLVDYSIATYWPEAANAPDPVLALFTQIVGAMAQLAAEWAAAGFVHGVLNTDNMVITGESFDYGPWRFLPVLEPGFTAAYFDESGLYCFGRQPGALAWNLARLAECLLPFTPQAGLETAIESYSEAFEIALARQTCARLGLAPSRDKQARALTLAFYGALTATKCPFECAFFDLFGGADPARLMESPSREAYHTAEFAQVLGLIRDCPVSASAASAFEGRYFSAERPQTMLIDEVERIWDAIDTREDWAPFEAKITAIREMGAAYAPFQQARAGHVVI
ncbi:MAG: protein adenylyltransferase SelO family protein [Bosea sp. (in: a-proteobacteria)]